MEKTPFHGQSIFHPGLTNMDQGPLTFAEIIMLELRYHEEVIFRIIAQIIHRFPVPSRLKDAKPHHNRQRILALYRLWQ